MEYEEIDEPWLTFLYTGTPPICQLHEYLQKHLIKWLIFLVCKRDVWRHEKLWIFHTKWMLMPLSWRMSPMVRLCVCVFWATPDDIILGCSQLWWGWIQWYLGDNSQCWDLTQGHLHPMCALQPTKTSLWHTLAYFQKSTVLFFVLLCFCS